MSYFLKFRTFILIFCLFSCSNIAENKTAEDYIKEGIEYTKNQKYDEAIFSYKKAIEKDPKNALAHHALGGIYTFKDKNERAIEEHKKAIELDPTYPDPHYGLGFVYKKLGRKEEAKKEFLLFEKLKKIEENKSTKTGSIDL